MKIEPYWDYRNGRMFWSFRCYLRRKCATIHNGDLNAETVSLNPALNEIAQPFEMLNVDRTAG